MGHFVKHFLVKLKRLGLSSVSFFKQYDIAYVWCLKW